MKIDRWEGGPKVVTSTALLSYAFIKKNFLKKYYLDKNRIKIIQAVTSALSSNKMTRSNKTKKMRLVNLTKSR